MNVKFIELLGTPKAHIATTQARIAPDVNAAKAEKICEMAHGQILNAEEWAISSQAGNGRFNDYPGREYAASAAEVVNIKQFDEDIVCSHAKAWGIFYAHLG